MSIEIVWSARVFEYGGPDGAIIKDVEALGFQAAATSTADLVKRLDTGLGDMVEGLKARVRDYFLPPVPAPKDQFERAARAWAEHRLDLPEGEVAKVEFSGECVGCYSCEWTPGNYEVTVAVTLRDGSTKYIGDAPLDVGEILREVLQHG